MNNRIAKVLGVLAVVGLLASLMPATIAQGASNAQDADGDGTAQVIPGRVGVLFNDGVTDPKATAHEMAREHGFKVVHVFSSALKGFGAKDVPAGRIKALRNDPRVIPEGLDPARGHVLGAEALEGGGEDVDHLEAVLAGHLVGGGLGVGDAIVEQDADPARYDLRRAVSIRVLGVASPLSDRRRHEACQQADDRQHAQHFSNPVVHRKASAVLRVIERGSHSFAAHHYTPAAQPTGSPESDTRRSLLAMPRVPPCDSCGRVCCTNVVGASY